MTKERVRRAIEKLNAGEAGTLALGSDVASDRGFRVFRLAESNFLSWLADDAADDTALTRQIALHVTHTRQDRSVDDLLYEILLKSGFQLTAPVELYRLAGRTVYGTAHGSFLICLERDLTLDVIRAMSDRKPERVVCLDQGFAGNDQLKANAVQIFKNKGVTSFKTV